MNKLRSDSHWTELNKEQRALLDKWLFDDNLSYVETLKRAKAEFGIEASLSSIKRYRARAAQGHLLYQLTDGTAIAKCPKRADGARKFSHAMAARMAMMKAMELMSDRSGQQKNLVAFLRLLVRDNAASGMVKVMAEACEIKRDWLELKHEIAAFQATKYFERNRLREKRLDAKLAKNRPPKTASARVNPEGFKI